MTASIRIGQAAPVKVPAITLAPPAAARPSATSLPSLPQPTVDAPTEHLIQGALRFLASKQTPSGAWMGPGDNHQAAITAYVLHAFLATGNLPGEGEHGKVVSRGVDFLLDCVRPDGYIAAPSGENNMYGHGISTVILGEVYGSSRDPRVKVALERAVRLIVTGQNPQGGWRYQPRSTDADISVTVLQVAALRVAQNSGIAVPQATIDRATAYVRQCYDEPTGGFHYQSVGGTPGFARTCAAIYTLQLLGHYNDPMVLRGAAYAWKSMDEQQEWFTYGNFYAAPAMYMIGGDTWIRWYTRLQTKLVPLAQSKGDQVWWRPIDGGNGQNDVYATAVYTAVLAMPYQYLPIYQR
jgi:hypothetical protein